VLAEGGIKQRLQHLQQSLLYQPIHDRRDAKLALPFVRLRDRHSAHRLRPVRPTQQLFTNRGPLPHQALGHFVDPKTVDTSRALVGPYSLPCLLHVRSGQHCRKQSGPRVLRFMARAQGFVADRFRQGFTLLAAGPLRLRGHLTPCPPHRHGGFHSFSFGPSSACAN
jgi:hypothetical protein